MSGTRLKRFTAILTLCLSAGWACGAIAFTFNPINDMFWAKPELSDMPEDWQEMVSDPGSNTSPDCDEFSIDSACADNQVSGPSADEETFDYTEGLLGFSEEQNGGGEGSGSGSGSGSDADADADSGSGSNGATTEVHAPATLGLMGLGLVLLSYHYQQRRQKTLNLQS